MPGVFPLQPFPVFLDPNQQAVHTNATITTSGERLFTGYGASEVSLFINVTAAPTGTTPTLLFTLQEVDPGDGVTPIGTPVVSSLITGVGFQRITMLSTFSGAILVSWRIGGDTPSFTQVYATLNAKTRSVTLVDSGGIEHGIATNPLYTQTVSADGGIPSDQTFLTPEMLSELRQIRKLLEILTEESVQDEE